MVVPIGRVCRLPIVLFLFLIFFIGVDIWPQSTHQRLEIENKRSNIITPLFNVTYIYSDYDGSYTYGLRTVLGIQYIFENRFFVLFSLPLYLQMIDKKDSIGGMNYAPGDADLTAGYMLKWGDYKIRFYSKYTYPSGIWNQYEVAEKRIRSGNGYNVLSVATDIARIMDPVVLSFLVLYSIDLPREERFGWVMTMGRVNIAFNYTEVLNDRIGVRVGVENVIAFPSVYNKRIIDDGVRYSLSVVFAVLYNRDDTDFQFGISKLMTDATAYPSINFSISHDFGF